MRLYTAGFVGVVCISSFAASTVLAARELAGCKSMPSNHDGGLEHRHQLQDIRKETRHISIKTGDLGSAAGVLA